MLEEKNERKMREIKNKKMRFVMRMNICNLLENFFSPFQIHFYIKTYPLALHREWMRRSCKEGR